MTERPQTPEESIAALVHDALGTEPLRIGVEVMDDRMRVTVPVRNYAVSGISLLARRTSRMYEVSETAATGTIGFMDNPERAEREERVPHTGEEILTNIADYLSQSPGTTEAENPDKATQPPTFAGRVTSNKAEQLELIPR